MKVELFLDGLTKLEDQGEDPDITHQAEARVAVRGLPVLMHDQVTQHHSPILLELEKERVGEPIPLFTVFLIPSEAADEKTCQYALLLAVHQQRHRGGFLSLRNHLEQIPLWQDQLVVDLRQETEGIYSGSWAWRSSQVNPEDEPDRRLKWTERDSFREVRLPLPPRARELMGAKADLLMRAAPWH